MGANTKISWCDSTFNPWVGCTKVSPACEHCYAETWAKRSGDVKWGPHPRRRTSEANWKLPLKWNRKAGIKIDGWKKFRDEIPDMTDEEMQARGFIKPRRPRVFCGSLCDVFDDRVSIEWFTELFRLIHDTPNLDWLLLTKRISNANGAYQAAMGPSWDQDDPWPENVWLGITVCNQEEADRDIPKLLAIPAEKRFVSIEPMLGPIDLFNASALVHESDGDAWEREEAICSRDIYHPPYEPQESIDWVIVGSESGPNRRPADIEWIRSIREQCESASVPLFVKQIDFGGKLVKDVSEFPEDLRIQEFPQ